MEDLQQLEGQLQGVRRQRQQYQRQVLEFENALDELKSTKEAYQIVGSVMIKKDAAAISTDLEKKKEVASLRLDTLAKQEETLQEEVLELQKKVMSDLDKGDA